mgnify:CR=1 FL=1|nr:MAG TPA: hypothetical protein [Caudoviricetes sp.]
MNINVSQIVTEKLAQLEADGTIKKKIEEALEKTITEAIISELSSYSLRREIAKQLEDSVSGLAASCGLDAYNGYIAEKCKSIIQEHFTADIGAKVEKSLKDIMFAKHDGVKLSDIFEKYREWVLSNTDESDKYDREEFTHELVEQERGYWRTYTCRFADRKLDDYEKPDIEIRFLQYRDNDECSISFLYLDGHNVKETFKVGAITDFEAFVLNLYYNDTKITMDADNVEEDPCFDIDI